MPIYGYACKQCEHSSDVLQRMSDPVLVECPECGEQSLRKQLSAPKFRLKGKGWYETDFKTGDKRNIAGEAEKKSDSKKPDTAEKKTETKKSSDKKPTYNSKAKST